MNKKIKIYVDMDGVLADYHKSYKEDLKKNPDIKYPQSVYGFFTKLKPIKNSIKTYKWLHKNFDTYILTAPSYKNPLCYTEKRIWVETHLGLDIAKKLIISNYKNLNKGDYLIDDNFEGRGQDKFDGMLLLFNENNNWKDIKKYLKGQL